MPPRSTSTSSTRWRATSSRPVTPTTPAAGGSTTSVRSRRGSPPGSSRAGAGDRRAADRRANGAIEAMSDERPSRRRSAAAPVIALRAGWRALRGAASGARRRPGRGRPAAGRTRAGVTFPAIGGPRLWVALLLFARGRAGASVSSPSMCSTQFDTQLLGLAMGGDAGAAGRRGDRRRQVRRPAADERRRSATRCSTSDEAGELVELIESGGEGISRRGLLTGAGGAGGRGARDRGRCTVGITWAGPYRAARLAVATRDPPGRRADGQPYRADEIEIGSFYTALPEGETRSRSAPGCWSSACRTVIHLPRAASRGRRRGSWRSRRSARTPGARSRCTAIRPIAPTSVSQPAFTCPCHYSTFTPADGGRVIFGPAGRPLPQLPLMIDDAGDLRAAGHFDEDIGPSWWGVRRT